MKVLNEAFDGEARLITVRGEPGSGKTTLLSWLALECAEDRVTSSVPALDNRLPVFLRIREYANTALPSGPQLMSSQFGAASDTFTDKWLNAKLKSGELVFFLDGFDEISEERRAEVTKWLGELLLYYQKAIFVVSTRPYAINQLEDLIREHGSQDGEILVEPMSPKQVNSFINHWYRAFSTEHEGSDEGLRFERARDRLAERLLNNTSLRSLVRNPLICSLICFVNADRDGFVPDQRGDLYRLATETLLDRRDVERGVTHGQDIVLTRSQKFKILGYIAEYFSKRRSAQLEVGAVEASLSEYLPSLGLRDSDSAAIVSYLSERSHVLRAPAPGVIDYSYKTFLEYFYARRMTEQNLIEAAAEAFFMPDSREIVLFAFSVGAEPFTNAVLERILPKICVQKASQPEVKHSILLMQSAIHQATEVSPEIRRAALDLLSEVLPPKSNEEAEELALAGDVILEPLSGYATEKYRLYWAHIVSAMLNTFSDEAIYSLVPYARLGDSNIDKRLISGRRFFEADNYKDVIVRECKTVKFLEVNDWHDLDMISALPKLERILVRSFSDNWEDAEQTIVNGIKSLEISDASSVSDLAIIRRFPNLEILSIHGSESIEDFNDISGCKNLNDLTIYSGSLTSLEFCESLKKLSRLDLAECTELKNVIVLNKLPRLKSLSLPYSHLYDQITLSLEDRNFDLDDDFIDFFDPNDDELSEITARQVSLRDF